MPQTTSNRNDETPVFPICPTSRFPIVPADDPDAFQFIAVALATSAATTMVGEHAVSGLARKNVWITTACGQRFSINQIGSMFGRE